MYLREFIEVGRRVHLEVDGVGQCIVLVGPVLDESLLVHRHYSLMFDISLQKQ